MDEFWNKEKFCDSFQKTGKFKKNVKVIKPQVSINGKKIEKISEIFFKK